MVRPACAVLLVTLFYPMCSGAADPPPTISPAVTFSQDEKSVTVSYAKNSWNFSRPVTSPWAYRVVGKMYWVAPNGNDANKGSEARPFKTATRALAAAGAGDIVYLRPGTYAEALRIAKSGTAGKPIVLSCAPGALGKVKITPPRAYVEKNPGGAVITVTDGAQHVWVNGQVVEGPRGRPEAPAREMYGANGITWSGKAGPGCRATNNVVYSNVHCGLKEMGHGGTHILMEANLVFENGTEMRDHGIYCPADDLTINGNIIFNNVGFGIHSYSQPRRQMITRNICFGNKFAGIILAGSENKVFHNVCAFNGTGLTYFRAGCTDNVVKNNIFAFNTTDGGYDNGGGKLGDPARNSDDYNCYFPGQPAVQVSPGLHQVLADPLFESAQTGDYRLRPGSPCARAGTRGARSARPAGCWCPAGTVTTTSRWPTGSRSRRGCSAGRGTTGSRAGTGTTTCRAAAGTTFSPAAPGRTSSSEAGGPTGSPAAAAMTS
jgi:parallel beta-helix repeat protein